MARIDSISASPPVSSSQSSSKAQKKTTKASRSVKDSISSKKVDGKEKTSSCWGKTYTLGKKILTKTKDVHKKSKSTKAPSILKKSKKDIKKKSPKKPEELKKTSGPIFPSNIQDLPMEPIVNALSTPPTKPPPHYQGKPASLSLPTPVSALINNIIKGLIEDPELCESAQNLLKNREDTKLFSLFLNKLQITLRACNHEHFANTLGAKMKDRSFIPQAQQILGTIVTK